MQYRTKIDLYIEIKENNQNHKPIIAYILNHLW
jgi:hypothetical protein